MLPRLLVIGMLSSGFSQNDVGEEFAVATGINPPSLRFVAGSCIRVTPMSYGEERPFGKVYCLG
jgi:hypothetical protein